MGFRAHVSAATLKPFCPLDQAHDVREFPRSRERGHIEARLNNESPALDRLFPRSRERGHIEAPCNHGKRRRASGAFPRSRERGHIEAFLQSLLYSPQSRFRAHVSAATLKPAPQKSGAAKSRQKKSATMN